MDRPTVLIVEDDATVRALIAELLEEAGYAVLEADCGKQALRLAHDQLPTVAVVDHRLPDMSGLDVLERLRTRQASRYIPVMLVSGLAHQLVNQDHGADRVLFKPFDITVLVDQVNALVGYAQDGVA
jgi:two-component system, OmpR family, phosphate regulon response regulator PhoB